MDNINDIVSSLSAEDMEMLKGVATSLLGGGSPPPQIQDQNTPKSAVNTNPLGISAEDFSMMMRAKSILDRMNDSSSKNADLINALKPHLSPQSREKADQAIRILRLFDVLPYIKDLF